MKFCTECSNMLYISINEEDSNKLTYYCRNCGYKDNTVAEDSMCILNSQLKKGEQNFNHIINEYTKFDNTLPCIYNVHCPSSTCKSNTNETKTFPEVIYMRYDDANLKYLYICSECDTVWKTDDNK